MADVRVAIDGRELVLTNLDKVLYPDSGTSKAGVIDYYARIAPVMVPHLAGRALTLVRCPDGVDGERFFEKRSPVGRPGWVPTGGEQDGVIVEEPATLVWLANLAALELHAHQHRAGHEGRPDTLVVDLDPGAPAGVLDCARVALDLRRALDHVGLTSVVKTSGSKGLHVSVPLHTGRVTDDDTKAVARAAGQVLADADPGRVTIAMARDRRGGKVFVDWSQNDAHKTTVTAYSLRARSRPTVSTPVAWDEVEDALAAGDADALTFETDAVLERVERLGDLFAANLTQVQDLPALA